GRRTGAPAREPAGVRVCGAARRRVPSLRRVLRGADAASPVRRGVRGVLQRGPPLAPAAWAVALAPRMITSAAEHRGRLSPQGLARKLVSALDRVLPERCRVAFGRRGSPPRATAD